MYRLTIAIECWDEEADDWFTVVDEYDSSPHREGLITILEGTAARLASGAMSLVIPTE